MAGAASCRSVSYLRMPTKGVTPMPPPTRATLARRKALDATRASRSRNAGGKETGGGTMAAAAGVDGWYLPRDAVLEHNLLPSALVASAAFYSHQQHLALTSYSVSMFSGNS